MLSAASPIEAIHQWIGLDEPLVHAAKELLGSYERVRDIAGIPLGDFNDALREAFTEAPQVVGEGEQPPAARERKLRPLERAKVGHLRRVARILCGVDPDDDGGRLVADPTEQPTEPGD